MREGCNAQTPPGPSRAPAGVLLVVSGPSGAGKDTVIESLRSYEPSLQYCVSVTTRPPRPFEQDGVHYHFTTRDNFEKMAAAGEFIETREYAGNLYGTPRRTVEEALAHGRDLILKPDVQGARAIKAQYPGAVLVFLAPPTTDELQRRLAQRQADSPEAIAQRLRIAREELAALTDFDYRVVNDTLAGAVSDLRAILTAERLKVARLAGRMDVWQASGKPV